MGLPGGAAGHEEKNRLDKRKAIQQFFIETPKKNQVMTFSATNTAGTRGFCKQHMQDLHEIRVNEESKITLYGLLQFNVKLSEKEKNRKPNKLLGALKFNKVAVFVKSVQRAIAFDELLVKCNFPSLAMEFMNSYT
ncbi:unnamed protein product [Prorocentrum cordatum]|uniref:Uncharacterized protein n=1 Tax=Prorocentrum cordatum TaxID=2364126 RepID=A0ABN9QPY2_9DINO|nr:unnamed protein product [Polarella glacialis]